MKSKVAVTQILLKKRVDRLYEGFERLEQDTAKFDSEEAKSLRIFLHTKKEEAGMLRTSIEQQEEIPRELNEKYIDDIRRLKHDYHTGHRRWQALYPAHSRRQMNIAA